MKCDAYQIATYIIYVFIGQDGELGSPGPIGEPGTYKFI